MFEAFLVTTSSEGLRPLGSAPQRSFELITSTVRAQISEDAATLFAEPVATEHGDRIDWYAQVAGTATPLPDLPPEDQARLRTLLGDRIAPIRALARTLGQSDSSDDQRLAEALNNAIEIPDEAMIHAVRGADGTLQPVLVHWAWVRDEQKAVRGILTAMVARPAAPARAGSAVASAPMGPGARGGGGAASGVWWWLIALGWLLLALLLGLILYLMIAPCGLAGGRPYFCPADPPALRAGDTEHRVITDQIAILERELALRDRACKPTIPVQPARVPQTLSPGLPDAPPAPLDKTQTDADRADVDRRIAERGAQRGALNFALEWATRDDIDLYVTCPTGQTVSYKNRSDCNGTYDLDANVLAREAITDPVENVVFDPAMPGLYKVRAHLRGARTAGPKTVVLHVLRRDGPSQSYTGKVSDEQREWTTNISISR